jgi:hypothetical protein
VRVKNTLSGAEETGQKGRALACVHRCEWILYTWLTRYIIRKLHECVFGVKILHECFSWSGKAVHYITSFILTMCTILYVMCCEKRNRIETSCCFSL